MSETKGVGARAARAVAKARQAAADNPESLSAAIDGAARLINLRTGGRFSPVLGVASRYAKGKVSGQK